MYAVIGATGNTGRAVVKELKGLGEDPLCVVRNADKARETLGADAKIAIASAVSHSAFQFLPATTDDGWSCSYVIVVTWQQVAGETYLHPLIPRKTQELATPCAPHSNAVAVITDKNAVYDTASDSSWHRS